MFFAQALQKMKSQISLFQKLFIALTIGQSSVEFQITPSSPLYTTRIYESVFDFNALWIKLV